MGIILIRMAVEVLVVEGLNVRHVVPWGVERGFACLLGLLGLLAWEL
jgi:hypothetical protein